MYDNLIYTGQVNIRSRIKAVWKSLGILLSAIRGYVISGFAAPDEWISGIQAGMKMGHGARQAYTEIIDEMTNVLIEAANILENGYRGKAPDHPGFKPAWDAYCIIKDFMERYADSHIEEGHNLT